MVDLDIRNKPVLPFLACGLLSGLVIAAPGCDPGDLAAQCGLVCPDDGIVEGNASISGIVSVDSFFGAVINVRDAALNVSGTVRAELEGMAASVGVEVTPDMSLDALGAAVAGGLQAHLEGYIDINAGLQISYEPPKCQASVEVAVEAAAECDVEASPGSIEAKCMGSCEVSADVAADCQAMGTLECTGQAPNFDCQGTCSGDCQLEVAAACSGTCSGTCTGECSACTGGNCQQDGMGNITNCAGSCSADCQGTCKLEAAADCSGRCEGSCTYNPGNASCEAGATAKCDVSAMAEAECQGKCEGKVEPPEVSAECQASVDAKANASVECTPPSLSVKFRWNADLGIDGDLDAQAEFKAWLEGFKARFAALLAANAKLEIVGGAAADLLVAADGAVRGAFDGIADGGLDLKASIGIGCALTELEAVGTALAEAQGEISGSIQATASITAVVAGG